MAEDEKEVELVTKLCLTCKQDVPTKNFEMHTIHCKRFLTRCPHCKESVNKDHLDEHIKEYHVKIKCTDCGENVEKMELEDHKETLCRRRIVKCNYCDITLPACDIDEHKEPCGSRTEECETCKKRILIKELELHIAEGCKPLDTAVERNGTPSVNTTTNKPKSMYYHDIGNYRNGFNSGGTGFPINFLHEQMRPTETVERSFDKKTSRNSQFVDRKPRKGNAFGKLLQDKPQQTKVPPEIKKQLPGKFDDELPEYGIPDENSDDDDMNTEAMKGPPELTDDTFLPCEFCNISLPADSLVVHQAMCQEMPPTPGPSMPPTFWNNTTFNSSYDPDKNDSFLEQPQARGGTSKSMMQDNDDQTIPCEFCSESFPVDDVAVHQTSCSLNPLYLDSSSQSTSTREHRRARSLSPKPQTPPSKPQTLPPALVSPESHPPEAGKVRPPRRNVNLAPTFSNKSTPSPSVTGARPKIKPGNVGNSGMERAMPKPRGGAGKSGKNRRKPVQSTLTPHFQEVHVLGGDSTHQAPTFESRSTNMRGMHSSGNVFPWEQDYFSTPPASRTGNGRGNARDVGSSQPASRSRGTRGDAFSSLYSNGACTDSLDGLRGVARGSAGAQRSGFRRGGQSRGAGTVTIPNRDRNPLDGSNSFVQRGRAGLQLNGRGFEGRRVPASNVLEGAWEGGRSTESRGGHRLGGSDSRGARGRNARFK